MSQPKPEAADPEIPAELRSKLATSKRPAGFSPKSPEAEDDNAQTEVVELDVKNLKPFFKKLRERFNKGKFFKVENVTRDVEDPLTKEWTRKSYQVKVPVDLELGADGLPFVVSGISAEETKRVRALNYPDSPKRDPNLGDLTPAFAEWLYLEHMYDACVRYYGRSTHVQAWAVDHAP